MEGLIITDSKGWNNSADVVLLLDGSESMMNIIDKVKIAAKRVYQDFSSLNFNIRFKVFAFDRKKFVISKFTEDPMVFGEKLDKVLSMIENRELGMNEFTLPAIDWALDSEWKNLKRIVIVFTDECLKNGHDPEFQWYGPAGDEEPAVEKLIDKINQLKIRLVFIGINCPGKKDYNQILLKIEGALHVRIAREEFSSFKINDIVNMLKKSIYTTQAAQQSPPEVETDIYKIRGKIKVVSI